MTLVQKEVKKIYLGSTQVRPDIPYLCFTPVNSIPSITLNKTGSPTAVNIEYSKDGNEWWDYSI
jgi:hypothetical protein